MLTEVKVVTVRNVALAVSEFEYGIIIRAIGELKIRSEGQGFRGTAHACSDLTAELNMQRRVTRKARV